MAVNHRTSRKQVFKYIRWKKSPLKSFPVHAVAKATQKNKTQTSLQALVWVRDKHGCVVKLRHQLNLARRRDYTSKDRRFQQQSTLLACLPRLCFKSLKQSVFG
ncbi:hypothetical protein ACHWQZ_G011089 [Mnemiopsis leidyi]